MISAQTAPPPATPDRLDQRVFLHGISWEDYEFLLAMRGETGGVRVTYLKADGDA
ncbi:MAG: hypothetical protein U9Q81_20955 [Pseudomonadota bacterium]|nr:hypothetical protein [Pseudomonadota bacterium]